MISSGAREIVNESRKGAEAGQLVLDGWLLDSAVLVIFRFWCGQEFFVNVGIQ